jgi:nucleotide-binding universal stress UspA family protein
MPEQNGAHPVIVVGVDGSDESLEALRWAARAARLAGASLRAVSVWDYPTSLGWEPPYPLDFDPEGDARSVLDRSIAEVLGDQPDVPVEKVVREGHPAPVLEEEAKGADLLVIGSRGHGGFSGLLLGSVSAHCVHHAPTTVVVVRPRPPQPDGSA